MHLPHIKDAKKSCFTTSSLIRSEHQLFVHSFILFRNSVRRHLPCFEVYIKTRIKTLRLIFFLYVISMYRRSLRWPVLYSLLSSQYLQQFHLLSLAFNVILGVFSSQMKQHTLGVEIVTASHGKLIIFNKKSYFFLHTLDEIMINVFRSLLIFLNCNGKKMCSSWNFQ